MGRKSQTIKTLELQLIDSDKIYGEIMALNNKLKLRIKELEAELARSVKKAARKKK